LAADPNLVKACGPQPENFPYGPHLAPRCALPSFKFDNMEHSLSGLRQADIVVAARSIIDRLDRIPIALPALVLRLGVALAFWRSGLTKLPLGNDTIIALFREEYRIPLLPPEIAAYLATSLELSCPILLVLGLLTRPAAAALLAQTLVIQIFVYPTNYPDHLLWAGPLLYLLLRGPGSWSLDAAIRKSTLGRD
jgi:putative oxidoreductase